MSWTTATHQPAETTRATPETQELAHPLPERHGRTEQEHEGEGGHDEEGLQHLGDEPGADGRGRQHQPPRAAALERAHHGVGGDDAEQDEEGVGVVVAEHEGGDRRRGEDHPRDERRAGPEPPAHRGVEQADRGDTLERLGHEDAPGVEPEEAGRDLHDPEGRRAACRR